MEKNVDSAACLGKLDFGFWGKASLIVEKCWLFLVSLSSGEKGETSLFVRSWKQLVSSAHHSLRGSQHSSLVQFSLVVGDSRRYFNEAAVIMLCCSSLIFGGAS